MFSRFSLKSLGTTLHKLHQIFENTHYVFFSLNSVYFEDQPKASTLLNILVKITARFSVCDVCRLHYNSYITFDFESRAETDYHSRNKDVTFHVCFLEE
jgi:hypothetical protein